MNLSDQAYDGVKRRYRYSEWPRTVELSTLGAVRSFLPQLGDRHSLILEERVPMRDTPGAFSERYVSPTDPEVRVLVDIAVYRSIATAHDALLHMLSMAMAPTLPFAAEQGVPVGDVAFAGFGEILTAVLFVRRNVVVDLRSVGRTPMDVRELAFDIDSQIRDLPRAD